MSAETGNKITQEFSWNLEGVSDASLLIKVLFDIKEADIKLHIPTKFEIENKCIIAQGIEELDNVPIRKGLLLREELFDVKRMLVLRERLQEEDEVQYYVYQNKGTYLIVSLTVEDNKQDATSDIVSNEVDGILKS